MSRLWTDRAACRHTNPEVFFHLNNVENSAKARRLCKTCPVKDECLTAAIKARDFQGYRAGMTGEERKRHAAKQPKPDSVAEMVRLHAKRWTAPAIALRLGMDSAVVYRVLKLHRESGEAA